MRGIMPSPKERLFHGNGTCHNCNDGKTLLTTGGQENEARGSDKEEVSSGNCSTEEKKVKTGKSNVGFVIYFLCMLFR